GLGRGAPRTAEEALLCELVAKLLVLERVGPDDNFFYLGGDSIGAIRLVSLARERGLTLLHRDVFAKPVLGDLARTARWEAAEGSTAERPARLARPEREATWPLTPLQQGLLYHTQLT